MQIYWGHGTTPTARDADVLSMGLGFAGFNDADDLGEITVLWFHHYAAVYAVDAAAAADNNNGGCEEHNGDSMMYKR